MTKKLKDVFFIDDSAIGILESFLFHPEDAYNALQAGHKIRGMSVPDNQQTAYIKSIDLQNRTFTTQNRTIYVIM